MGLFVKDIKIANNIKNVELLKVELLKSVSELFEDINAEADSETAGRLTDDAANIINLTFVLSRRLGIGYDDLISCMKVKLDQSVKAQHPIEKNFQDMSELLERL